MNNNQYTKIVKVCVSKSISIDSRISVSNFKKRVASEFGIKDESQINLVVNGKILPNNQRLKTTAINEMTIDLDSEVTTQLSETNEKKGLKEKPHQKNKMKPPKPIRVLRSNNIKPMKTKRGAVKRLKKNKNILIQKSNKIKNKKSVKTSGGNETKTIGKRAAKPKKNFQKVVKRLVTKIGDDKSTIEIHSNSEVLEIKKPKPKKKEYKIQSIGSKSNSQSGNINDLVSKKKDDKNVNSIQKSTFDIKIRLMDDRELPPLSSCPKNLFEDFSGYCKKNRGELEDLLEWND